MCTYTCLASVNQCGSQSVGWFVSSNLFDCDVYCNLAMVRHKCNAKSCTVGLADNTHSNRFVLINNTAARVFCKKNAIQLFSVWSDAVRPDVCSRFQFAWFKLIWFDFYDKFTLHQIFFKQQKVNRTIEQSANHVWLFVDFHRFWFCTRVHRTLHSTRA